MACGCCCTKSQRKLDYEFATSTSCHGLGRIADSSRKPQRIFWILVTLFCFGYMVSQIVDRFDHFMQMKQTTELEVMMDQTSLEFPAVTICNYNKYRLSAMTESDAIILSNSALLMSYLQWGVPLDEEHVKFAQELEYNITQLYPDGFDMGNLTRRVGWQMDDTTLLWCRIAGKQCTFEDFSLVQTSYGNCYTFNRYPREPNVYKQTVHGTGGGLRIVLDINQSDYTEVFAFGGNSEAGIKFLVHPQYEPPSVESEGYAVSPGFRAYAGIRYDELQNAVSPWGKCDPEAKLKFYEKYSFEGCLSECREGKLLERCGCKPYSIPGNIPNCLPTKAVTCANEILGAIEENPKEECPQCTVACEEVEYPVSLSYATFPNHNIAKELFEIFDVTEDYIRDNIVELDIYFRDLYRHLTKMSPAVTPSGLLSDLGGQMGLFVGMSILTLFEFLEFTLRRLYLGCFRRNAEDTSDVKDGDIEAENVTNREMEDKSKNSPKQEKQSNMHHRHFTGDSASNDRTKEKDNVAYVSSF
ncbi:unnamed protein product [Owenia fusiformis]|uniref:Uncharacterized protein n=1 Tax=Owenia fusiformis TaxID=6347 RepID=A0A8S4NRX8_OWEFU|nr:unnamed protein product [Owenia fusiformis]